METPSTPDLRKQLEWEEIPTKYGGPYENVWRAPIIGGWLVCANVYNSYETSLTFVPDNHHEWELTDTYRKE